jgi:phenylacetate-coenzyme A ligase PaaK-like adenylate-forming protein
MNPFLNPLTGLPFIKNIIFDPGRLHRLNHKQMERYRDKVLRKTVKYAYTVPLYNKKYKDAGVHPDDIKGIENIIKLPFVTKKI